MKMINRIKWLRDNDMETLYEINVHLELSDKTRKRNQTERSMTYEDD